MNIAARTVKRFLRHLSHLSLMLTRCSARSAKAGMLRSRSQPLPAACQAAQAVHRQGPFPAVPPNPDSPEHDILGAVGSFNIYQSCRVDTIHPAAFFGACIKVLLRQLSENRDAGILLSPVFPCLT